MLNTRRSKITAFILSLLLFLTAGFFMQMINHSMETSTHVEILEKKPILSSYQYKDFSDLLLYRGQPLAIDRETSTIYISADFQDEADLRALWSGFRIITGGYKLFTVLEDPLPDSEPAGRNFKFPLYIMNRANRYMQYQVVFTTLPVMVLNGSYYDKDLQSGREIYSGDMALWTPDPRDELQFSKLHWHVRGASTSLLPKVSLKLSLKKTNGQNRHMNLLGLGEDDDWILNAINRDDTKVREKLFMDLWNQAADTSGQPHMSTGNYVEVIRNGTYEGLYLLQRRIDSKYLDLSPEDALYKGKQTYIDNQKSFYYEPLWGDPSMTPLLQDILSGKYPQAIQPENLIDLNLFLQLGNLYDNTFCKNMYYLLRPYEDFWQLQMIPWDTDISLGMQLNQVFYYDDTSWNAPPISRPETSFCREAVEDLDLRTALRWAELRKTVFAQENIFSVLERCYAAVSHSGALLRDQENWSEQYCGEDTIDSLKLWLSNRLTFLDHYYENNPS